MDVMIQNLVANGYNEDEVIDLISYDSNDIDTISDNVLALDSSYCVPKSNPTAIYIGGQPGAGKSILSMAIKKSSPNFVEIAMDNYRTYHPNYERIEECVKEHWKNRSLSENDSPGNDIAHFTHSFSGEMIDAIIEKATNKKYDVVIEWNLKEPYQPLESMKDLKNKGYNINVWSLAVSKDISSSAYKMRADIMNDYGHIMRRVSKNFHDSCIESLPDSLDYLKDNGLKRDVINQLCVVDRAGKCLWDKTSSGYPGDILSEKINESIKNAAIYNNVDFAKVSFLREVEGLKQLSLTDAVHK